MSCRPLVERDAAVLWHPYTQHGVALSPLPVASARGSYLTLEDGREILDAISSWWVNLHGHAEPSIAAAIARQAASLEQVIFAGFTHEPAVALAETLVAAARSCGANSSRLFYSDDGSTAVEVALKMAWQFRRNRGDDGRRRFVALSGAYHGDTLGAMAVGGPGGFEAVFRPLLMPVDFVAPGDAVALRELFAARPGEHAAMIVEPLVQGAGGMKFHSAAFLREAASVCRAAGVLLVADEVFTGFHRTGTLFAFEQAGIAPDLVCLSKGITGGFLPLGVTLATEEIFEAFRSDDRSRAFLHGHSFTANPVSCAAALASWELLAGETCAASRRAIAEATARGVARLAKHPRAENARSLGTIGAVDVRPKEGSAAGYFSALAPRIHALALDRGILLRPLGNVIYTVPPYSTTAAEIERIYAAISEILDDLENEP